MVAATDSIYRDDGKINYSVSETELLVGLSRGKRRGCKREQRGCGERRHGVGPTPHNEPSKLSFAGECVNGEVANESGDKRCGVGPRTAYAGPDVVALSEGMNRMSF
ncbi:hypothetical protein THAOC_00266 [Thalassiosira oceanica]|uniref:Uncharacterized protein n=1 Tax=Thalassiosira oceanica TaxID=159749 RepID=K0TJM1_THAOC|nr:hypothetical protein THAOC_00266 [Thalassiosira oceanica]|eukprot:EJK77870.1 hypothetical protein THAOC_00266 [Thalassiosira oceanica]